MRPHWPHKPPKCRYIGQVVVLRFWRLTWEPIMTLWKGKTSSKLSCFNGSMLGGVVLILFLLLLVVLFFLAPLLVVLLPVCEGDHTVAGTKNLEPALIQWKPFTSYCMLLHSHWFPLLPSGKLTWQWKIPIFNRKYIFKRSIFYCYVSLPEGIDYYNHHPFWDSTRLIVFAGQPKRSTAIQFQGRVQTLEVPSVDEQK